MERVGNTYAPDRSMGWRYPMSDSEVYDQQEHREDDHDSREVDTNPTEAGKWVSAPSSRCSDSG
jgi:hypothetical protein